MNTGQIISGLGHLGLIGWMLFGGTFRSEPLPFEVTEVSAISEAEFAALMQGAEGRVETPVIAAPDAPEEGAAPEVAAQADTPPAQAEPEPAPPATPDPVPDVSALTPPEAEVEDTAPPAPEPEQPSEDVAILMPEAAPTRPVERVAPEPVAPPEPDVAIADQTQEEVAPSNEPAEVQQEAQEAAAEEAAATEIVTEAETDRTQDMTQFAPTSSLRPKTRPARPAPTETAQTPETNAPAPSAVTDALAQALSESMNDSAPAPSGPPLTAGEKDALRVSVQKCWNVGSLSTEALGTTVTVAVTLTEDGKPVNSSLRMIGSEGGSDAAARHAYEAARRAIIRCGAQGFDLPSEKFAQWREIEMTFNPENMRIK